MAFKVKKITRIYIMKFGNKNGLKNTKQLKFTVAMVRQLMFTLATERQY